MVLFKIKMYMFICKSSFPVKFIDRSSDKISIQIFVVPNLTGVRWWMMDFKIKFCICNLMMKV